MIKRNFGSKAHDEKKNGAAWQAETPGTAEPELGVLGVLSKQT